MSLHDLHRSRNARGWFGLLVVLAFGFRALIPTGFMFAAVDGHARLVMCPAGIYHAAGMHHMVGMGHASGLNPASGMEHASGFAHAAHAALVNQCPFALASGAGFAASVHEPAEPYFVALQAARAGADSSIPVAPPARYHAPRGPPSLA